MLCHTSISLDRRRSRTSATQENFLAIVSPNQSRAANAISLPRDIAPKRIGIFGFNGVALMDFIGPIEAFKSARSFDNYHRRKACYEITIIGLDGKSFASTSGVSFRATKGLAEVSGLWDTVIIPGGDPTREARERLTIWLMKNRLRINRFASVAGGIFPLAESGLLNGCKVTTHWRFLRDAATRFPELSFQTTASFVKDGSFYTSGGGAAGMEMTLCLIEEDYGLRVALEVAREFVIRLRPPGSDRALRRRPKAEQQAEERLAELPAWILANLPNDLSIEALANRVCLCPRHFTRVFKASFATTPGELVEQLRLGEARSRLLEPKTTIESVAESVGFKSADAFSRAFRRHLGMPPGVFRSRSLNRSRN